MDINKDFQQWYEKHGTVNTDNKAIKLVDLVVFLKNKGYSEESIYKFGPEICKKLSNSKSSETIMNCHQLILAYEFKEILNIIYKDVQYNEIQYGSSEDEEVKEKEEIEIIETDPKMSIDMDVKDLNLQIETDTSFLDSLKVNKDE